MSTHRNLKDSNQARKAQKFRDQASLEHRLISRPTTNFLTQRVKGDTKLTT
jgi:hypothetical protein